MFQKLAKLGRRHLGTQACPEIRWDEVVRIAAHGTDALGVFEVSLDVLHRDGSEVRLFVEHQGFDRILESLPQRLPSIPPTWYDEMAQTPWDAARFLYLRENEAD
jgi:hypothetical protein